MKTPRSYISFAIVLCFLAGLLMPPSSQAAVIIGNIPAGDFNTTSISAIGNQAAVVFTMGSQDYFVNSVILSFGAYTTPTDTAQVGFFLDNGSGTNVGAQVGSFLIAPSSASGLNGLFTFLPNGSLTLDANTKYWLLLDCITSNFNWNGGITGPNPVGSGATYNGPYKFSSNNGASYSDIALKPTFQINGIVVPEPSRAMLMVLGLGAMIVRRRRA